MVLPRFKRPYRKIYRKRTVKSRRSFRRSMMVPIRPIRPSNVHHYKRTFLASDTLPIGPGLYYKGFYFKLSSLPNYTEFTSLYDEYRVNKILVKAIPNFSGSNLGPQGTSSVLQQIPNLHSVIDNDDSTDPTSLNELLQYGNHKMTRGNRIHSRLFTPAIQMASYEGSTQINVEKYKAWINCANPDVRFYGVKYALEGSNVTQGQFNVYVTMYISCKGVR